MPVLELISRLIALLPHSAALRLGRLLGWIFGSVVRHHRADAVDALRRALPDRSEADRRRILKNMYAKLGMSMVETIRLPYRREEYKQNYVEWEGMDNLHAARESGKGALLLSAHLDNWELLLMLAPEALGAKTSVIAKKIKTRIGQQYMDRNRRLFGTEMLPAKNSYRKCLKALRNNEIVVFVLDQNMIRREGEFVDFFGRPACTTLGLAHLAARTGAPIVPVFPKRLPGGHHCVQVLPALDPPPSAEKDDLIAATQLYTRLIEEAIRDEPDQWIWIHRRWKTRPEPGEASTQSDPA